MTWRLSCLFFTGRNSGEIDLVTRHLCKCHISLVDSIIWVGAKTSYWLLCNEVISRYRTRVAMMDDGVSKVTTEHWLKE